MEFNGAKQKLFIIIGIAAGILGLSGFTGDEELRTRVQAALDSDPYFYGKHVSVTVKNGDVILKGFVLSDWDLTDAIRIARRAAGRNRVIDDLSIEVGGIAR